MKPTKHLFIVEIEGKHDPDFAKVLARHALSESGVNPPTGTSVSLKIKQDGKNVSEQRVDKHGNHWIKIRNEKRKRNRGA